MNHSEPAQYWKHNTSGLRNSSSINESDIITTTSLIDAPLQAVGPPFVSFYTFTIFFAVLVFSLETPLALFGCLSNVVNIAVYLKMGVAESTTINILALSAVDLLVCVSTLVTVLGCNPFVVSWELPTGAKFSEIGFGAFIILYPCLGCSAWVTALLSVERCLCIALPLKVKTLVTNRRTTAFILFMATYELTCICLTFVNTGPPYTPSPSIDNKLQYYFLYSFSIPTCVCFPVIFVSTSLLAARLKSHQNQTRLKFASNTTLSNINAEKEEKATRFVIFICSMYLICFAPNAAIFLTSTLIVPNLQSNDHYLGSFTKVLYTFSVLFQTAYSSLNMFVYYSMSSKFREGFKRLFMAEIT